MTNSRGKAGFSRRSILTGLGGLACATAMPFVISSKARAANKELLVRTPGGKYDEIKRAAVYDPFEKETGIRVVPVPGTTAKLLAMHKSGQMDLDLIDGGDDSAILLGKAGALIDIDYSKFHYADPDNLEATIRRPQSTGSFNYAMVMAYNSDTFKGDHIPQDWKQFWDVKTFPGPRTMPGMASGAPDLEFALLADGVPVDKLYPIDIDRAFASLSKIKASVTKFWDTGAISSQLLTDKEVVLASLWSSRAAMAISDGAPVGLQWNQNAVLGQAYCIPKGSRKPDAALAFIDYTASAPVQSRWFSTFQAIPINKKAYGSMAKQLLDPKTNTPYTVSRGFVRDIEWWADNRAKVNKFWTNWIAQ